MSCPFEDMITVEAPPVTHYFKRRSKWTSNNLLIPNTREQIGEEVFNDAWKKGEAMTLEQAIDYALQGAPYRR